VVCLRQTGRSPLSHSESTGGAFQAKVEAHFQVKLLYPKYKMRRQEKPMRQ